MPTPWLSWPARFAATRCSATRSASASALPPALTSALMTARSASAVARIGLLRLAEAPHRGPSGHAPDHLATQRLEVLGGAVGLDGGLIDVALHEDVGVGGLTVVQRVELAAGLVRVHLRDQLLGDGLELLVHSGLDLQRRDDPQHASILLV